MTSRSFAWAKLPGLPRKVMWPVEVFKERRILYCNADDAWFPLKEGTTLTLFEDLNVEQQKATAKSALAKKLSTYTAFVEDIEWVQNCLEDEDSNGDRGQTEVEISAGGIQSDHSDTETHEKDNNNGVNAGDVVDSGSNVDPGQTEVGISAGGIQSDHSDTDTQEKDKTIYIYYMDHNVNADDIIDSSSSDRQPISDTADVDRGQTGVGISADGIQSDNTDTETQEDVNNNGVNADDVVVDSSSNVHPGQTEVGISAGGIQSDHSDTDTQEKDKTIYIYYMNHNVNADDIIDSSSSDRQPISDTADVDRGQTGVGISADGIQSDNTDTETQEDVNNNGVNADNVVDSSSNVHPGQTEVGISAGGIQSDHSETETYEKYNTIGINADDVVHGSSDSGSVSETYPKLNENFTWQSKKTKRKKLSRSEDSESEDDEIPVARDVTKSKKTKRKKSSRSGESESEDDEIPVARDVTKSKKTKRKKSSRSGDSESEDDEIPVARDVTNSKLYVRLVQKSVTTKLGKKKKSSRIYNATHPCPFCYKFVANFSHHIKTAQHRQESGVKEIIETTDSKSKQMKIHLLRLKGAHLHNMKTFEKKEGEIFLRRRSCVEDSGSEDSDEEVEMKIDIDKYGPCPQCFGWITLGSIKRHVKMCVASKDSYLSSASKGTLMAQSDILAGRVPQSASQALVNEVFPIMLDDEVGKVAKGDSLILNLGNQWMMRNKGNELMRKYYTSSVMRLAARMKIALHQLDESQERLEYYFKPQCFELVVKAALRCSLQGADEEELCSPSNAIKLGYDVKRMVYAMLAKALVADNAEMKKNAEDFLKLMEIEWGLRVTKLARIILTERAFNKEKQLPLPEDVKKLAEYMKSKLENSDLKTCSLANYKRVAVLSLARITLFNRRRCHEVQALKISSYQKRKTGENEMAVELRGELTAFERNLLNRQDIVVVRGKTGKGVPVILPEDVGKALEFLVSPDVRKTAGVPPGNPYVFGTNGAGVYRAYDAIKTTASAAALQFPNLIRTSNMRKYMATMLQALNTTEAERQWVLDHLGHTMDVHKIHYRMTSDVLERVDVAKILLIQDLGLVGQYRGKRLDDIQLNDLIQTEAEDVGPEGIVENTLVSSAVLDADADDEFVPDEDSTEEQEEETVPKKKKRATHNTRQKWSTDEVEEIETLFKKDFETDKCPSQKRVESLMGLSLSNGGSIHKRKRDTIKKKVNNMMLKIRNQPC